MVPGDDPAAEEQMRALVPTAERDDGVAHPLSEEEVLAAREGERRLSSLLRRVEV